MKNTQIRNKKFNGEFSVDFQANHLNFTYKTENISFAEIVDALQKLRDVLQRQINSETAKIIYTESLL